MNSDFVSPPEEQASPAAPRRRWPNTMRLIIFQPGQAFAEIVGQERKAYWMAPVVLIILLAVLAALLSTQTTSRTAAVTSGTRSSVQATAQTTRTANRSSSSSSSSSQQGGFAGGPGGGVPPDFAGAVPFDVGGFGGAPGGTASTTSSTASSAAATTPTSLLITAGFPAVSFLITWLLLGVLINVLSVAFGGHSSALMAMNISAWASIPLGVRSFMQLIYYLATNSSINSPGLSGFAPTPGTNNLLIYLQQVLSRIDIYLFWQVGLLAVGLAVWGGMSKKKSVPAAIIAVVILLLLQALLAFGLQLLGNVNINTSMLMRLR